MGTLRLAIQTISDFYVQEYRNKKGVSNAQQGSTIEPIANIDIGDISTDNYTNDEEADVIDAINVAVPKLERYKACIHLKATKEQRRLPVHNAMTFVETMQLMIVPNAHKVSVIITNSKICLVSMILITSLEMPFSAYQ